LNRSAQFIVGTTPPADVLVVQPAGITDRLGDHVGVVAGVDVAAIRPRSQLELIQATCKTALRLIRSDQSPSVGERRNRNPEFGKGRPECVADLEWVRSGEACEGHDG